MKTKIDTHTAIRNAELSAKQFEFERLQAEYEGELASKEVELDSQMREEQNVINELNAKIELLEVELSNIKERITFAI